MKYAFIDAHCAVWPISVQCYVLEASMAGYREHSVRKATAAQRRYVSNYALLVYIKVIQAEIDGTCG